MNISQHQLRCLVEINSFTYRNLYHTPFFLSFTLYFSFVPFFRSFVPSLFCRFFFGFLFYSFVRSFVRSFFCFSLRVFSPDFPSVLFFLSFFLSLHLSLTDCSQILFLPYRLRRNCGQKKRVEVVFFTRCFVHLFPSFFLFNSKQESLSF